MHVIEIITATRRDPDGFWNDSALGQSLKRIGHDQRISPKVAVNNSRGLPEIYNRRIRAADSADILAFVHDDVWIDDAYLADRIIDGLARYDVIGVAGNRRRSPGQPAWSFIDTAWTWDKPENLSGSVGHGDGPCGAVQYYGPSPADCELLDGVFLAARRSVLAESGTLFDTRFDFNFYDMDFCRTARSNGLQLGTWPVALTHQSAGTFGLTPWQVKYAVYLGKWGD